MGKYHEDLDNHCSS